MTVLADSLQDLSPADFPVPVVDQTGLSGTFNFRLDWTPTPKETAGSAASAAPSATSPEPLAGPTLTDAVEAQLGIKLESRKLPLPVIVIDRLERLPTDN